MRHSKASSSGTRGFTLIELLVVVAIIGLLSSVVLASLNGARVKGRDARRLADVKQIQLALELYYDDSDNKYPASVSGNWLANVVGLTPTYISTMPHDPNISSPGTGNDYRYWSSGAANQRKGYSVLIRLERATDWCRVTVGEIIPSGWTDNPDCSEV
ncbi:TPA: hypothetical protein DIS55_04180 [Candidatus Kaiserbacteria bacterium]|nr:hypothetical protein [Candidatus Kaiserbacteria bacterium]